MINRIQTMPEKHSNSRQISIIIASAGVVLSITAGMFITGMANFLQVFLVVFALVAFIFTFARLELGIAAIVFLLYTQAYIIVGERYGVPNVAQGLIMLLVLCMATRWILYIDEIPKGWILPLFLIFFYCIIGLASVLYAENSDAAIPVAIETLKSGMIALIICVVLSTYRSFRLVVWVLITVGILLGSLSVYQFITGTYSNDYGGFALAAIQNIVGQTNDYRLGGPVGDPNYFAQMMLVLVPLALDRFWNEEQKFLRLVAGWALGVCSLTVILTYSRGGFLSMVAVIFAMIFLFHRGQVRYLVAVLAIGFLLLNLLPPQFSERLGTLTELIPTSSSSTNLTATDYSIRGRTSEMLVAIQMFADHPILGVGLGNYPLLYQQYSRQLGIDTRSGVRQPHNLYLEVAAETGLLGLLSFILLLWITLRSIWRAQQSLIRTGLQSVSNIVAAFAFSYIGYLISSLFIHSAYPRNFWVLAGIALSIPQLALNEIESFETLKHKLRYSLSPVSPSK